MPKISFELFRLRNMTTLLSFMVSVVKKIDTRHPVFSHPYFPMVMWETPSLQDDWQMAGELDMFGLSFYHKEDAPGDLEQPWHTAAVLASIRSAAASSGKPYFLPEIQSNQRTGYSTYGSMDRYDIEQIAWQSFAHESKGTIFWKWHPFQQGQQNQGRGLTDTKGAPTERALAVGDVARVIKKNDKLFQASKYVQNNIGIMYDVTNALKTWVLTSIYNFAREIRPYSKKHIYGVYRELWSQVYNSTIIKSEDIASGRLSGIDSLCASFQQIVSNGVEENLDKFVKQGGIFAADARFGNNSDFDVTFITPPG
jgi:hypothetical protein